MECGNDLNCRRRKRLIIEEIRKAKTNKSIAERINCSVMTEIGKSVRIFRKVLQRGKVILIAVVYTYFNGNFSRKTQYMSADSFSSSVTRKRPVISFRIIPPQIITTEQLC